MQGERGKKREVKRDKQREREGRREKGKKKGWVKNYSTFLNLLFFSFFCFLPFFFAGRQAKNTLKY